MTPVIVIAAYDDCALVGQSHGFVAGDHTGSPP